MVGERQEQIVDISPKKKHENFDFVTELQNQEKWQLVLIYNLSNLPSIYGLSFLYECLLQ